MNGEQAILDRNHAALTEIFRPRPSVADHFRHYLNPLHVYCRLRPILGQGRARQVCGVYTRIYNLFL